MMTNYDDNDLGLDNEGDLEIDETGDLSLVQDYECLADDIIIAVNTQTNDSEVYPGFGADLEEFIGMPNTREIGMAARQRIFDVLANNGIANPGDLKVIPVPIADEILYYIIVERNGEEVVIEYPLDLNFGG